MSQQFFGVPEFIKNVKNIVINDKKPIGRVMVIQTSIVQDLLQNFVTGTPDVQGAALVSPDGLPLSSFLSSGMDEERTAAMSAAMLSLGDRIGQELTRGGIDRLFLEGENGYSILVGCSSEAVLLVLAGKQAKQGLLFLEIKRLATELSKLLG